MKTTVNSVTLFNAAGARSVDARLETFAREFARRHRRRSADTAQFLAALRAYHRIWSIVDQTLPPLDDTAVRLAVAAYQGAFVKRRAAA